MTPALP